MDKEQTKKKKDTLKKSNQKTNTKKKKTDTKKKEKKIVEKQPEIKKVETKKAEVKKEKVKVEKIEVNKVKKNKNKFVHYVLITLFVIVILFDCYLLYGLVKKPDGSLTNYSKDGVSFSYNSYYTKDVTIKGVNRTIEFTKNNPEAEIVVNIAKLPEEVLELKKDVIIDQFVSDFKKSNEETLKFVYSGNLSTDNELSGKDFLFFNEKNKQQVNINAFVEEDKLVTITYKAKNENFDLALEDVQDIINTLEIK